MGRQLGVRGFPTLFFTDTINNRLTVYGFKPYEIFERTLQTLLPEAQKTPIKTDWASLFSHYPTLTTKEFFVLSGISKQETERLLEGLFSGRLLKKTVSKNGVLWRK